MANYVDGVGYQCRGRGTCSSAYYRASELTNETGSRCLYTESCAPLLRTSWLLCKHFFRVKVKSHGETHPSQWLTTFFHSSSTVIPVGKLIVFCISLLLFYIFRSARLSSSSAIECTINKLRFIFNKTEIQSNTSSIIPWNNERSQGLRLPFQCGLNWYYNKIWDACSISAGPFFFFHILWIMINDHDGFCIRICSGSPFLPMLTRSTWFFFLLFSIFERCKQCHLYLIRGGSEYAGGCVDMEEDAILSLHVCISSNLSRAMEIGTNVYPAFAKWTLLCFVFFFARDFVCNNSNIQWI